MYSRLEMQMQESLIKQTGGNVKQTKDKDKLTNRNKNRAKQINTNCNKVCKEHSKVMEHKTDKKNPFKTQSKS